jgi:hypothetical protein
MCSIFFASEPGVISASDPLSPLHVIQTQSMSRQRNIRLTMSISPSLSMSLGISLRMEFIVCSITLCEGLGVWEGVVARDGMLDVV